MASGRLNNPAFLAIMRDGIQQRHWYISWRTWVNSYGHHIVEDDVKDAPNCNSKLKPSEFAVIIIGEDAQYKIMADAEHQAEEEYVKASLKSWAHADNRIFYAFD